MDNLLEGVENRRLIDGLWELRRERLMRKRVYPRLIMQSKLSQADADKQMAALEDAISVLEELLSRAGAQVSMPTERMGERLTARPPFSKR